MKIEMCEQMLQSWLQHCEQCEIVQTNWMVSPLRVDKITDAEIADVAAIMKEVQAELNQVLSDDIKTALQEEVDEESEEHEDTSATPKKRRKKVTKLDIFKQSKARQFIRQCEIDVVGCKLDEGITDKIYLVDTAFHKSGLGYHNPVATVVKKIVRAMVVAVIIFGEYVPVKVVFAAPKCGDTLKNELEDVVNKLRHILSAKSRYANIEIELYFNERFATDIYLPLVSQIDHLNNDNDLYMRAMNLSQVAAGYAPAPAAAPAAAPATAPSSKAGKARASRGTNESQMFAILNDMIKNGKMIPAVLNDLQTPAFVNARFKISTYPLLIKEAYFPYSSHERCRFYKRSITIHGEKYLVCSQLSQEKIDKIDQWCNTL